MTIATPTMPGLVWAYHFDTQAGRCQTLPLSTSRAELDALPGFFWLHFNLADARVLALLETFTDIPPRGLSALVTHDNHAALTLDEQQIFGTLVDFQRKFDRNSSDVGWLHFFVSQRMIITTRLQPLQSVERVRGAVERLGGRYRQPIDVFETLVVELQRTMIGLGEEIAEELNEIEEFVYDSLPSDERRQLMPLRRNAVRMHRHVRAVLSILRYADDADEADMPPGFDEVAARLIARLEAAEHDIFALQERARLLHEEIVSQISEQTNRHLYVLSLMAAFLLPPTLVTGFFGMNTSSLPFEGGSYGTYFAFGWIIVSIVGAWLAMKRIRIL